MNAMASMTNLFKVLITSRDMMCVLNTCYTQQGRVVIPPIHLLGTVCLYLGVQLSVILGSMIGNEG